MDTDWAKEFVSGMIGKGMGTKDSYQGGKMNWERVRPVRDGWRPAKHIFIWKCGARRPAQRLGPPSRCYGTIKRSRSPILAAFSISHETRHPPGTAPFVNRSPPCLQILKMLKCEELTAL
jgi:hypothetical protein